jgi:uroporphyrinogen-III synthase
MDKAEQLVSRLRIAGIEPVLCYIVRLEKGLVVYLDKRHENIIEKCYEFPNVIVLM